MRYSLRHRSNYSYSEAVDFSYHLLRLRPRALPHQRVESVRLTAEPAPAHAVEGTDYFGNGVTHLTLAAPHSHFTADLEAVVDVQFPLAPLAATTPPWESVRDTLRAGGSTELVEAAEFTFESPSATPTPEIAAYAGESFAPGRPLLDGVLDLTARINRDFVFDPAATVVTTPLAEVMQQRRGVCQDFAHLEVAALRSLGLAARYVSGYIRTFREGTPGLTGSDASHAWVSVFCPGAGWVDVDPTNNLIVDAAHIVLGWGRDYGDVSPIRGVILGGGEHFLSVSVEVMPLG